MRKFCRKYFVPVIAGSGLIAATTLAAATQGSVAKPTGQVSPLPVWQKVTPVGGRFSVMMPAAPTSDVKTNDTSFGVVTAHIFTYQNEHKWYGVIWTDYPLKVRLDESREMDADRDNFIAQLKGRLLAERNTILGGIAGREFTAEAPNAFVTSRIFVVGNRTYQIAIAVPTGQEHTPEIDRFLSSFQILK